MSKSTSIPQPDDAAGIARLVEEASLHEQASSRLTDALAVEFGKVAMGSPLARISPLLDEISRRGLRLPPEKLLKACYSPWRLACRSGGQNEMSAVYTAAIAVFACVRIEDVVSEMVMASRRLTQPVEIDEGAPSLASFIADLLSQALDTQDFLTEEDLKAARSALELLSYDPILGEAAGQLAGLLPQS